MNGRQVIRLVFQKPEFRPLFEISIHQKQSAGVRNLFIKRWRNKYFPFPAFPTANNTGGDLYESAYLLPSIWKHLSKIGAVFDFASLESPIIQSLYLPYTLAVREEGGIFMVFIFVAVVMAVGPPVDYASRLPHFETQVI